MAMRDVFDNFAVDVFSELNRSLGSAGGAYPPAFAGEGDEDRVLTTVAVYPCGAVSEDAAVKVLIKGLQHLIPQASILMLEPSLPLELEVIPGVVDDLVKGRGFRSPSPVVLQLLLRLLPRVAPEHAGWFGEVRLGVVSELGRRAEGDSGQTSGRAVYLRSFGLSVRIWALDVPGDARRTLE